MRLSLNVSPTQPAFASDAQPRTESNLSRIQNIFHAAKQCIQNVATRVSDVCLRKPRSNSDSPLQQCLPTEIGIYEPIYNYDRKSLSTILKRTNVEQYPQIQDERLPKLAPGLAVVEVPVRNKDGVKRTLTAVHAKKLPSSQASLKEKARFMLSLDSLVNSEVIDRYTALGHGCMALIEKDRGTLRGYFKTLELAYALHSKFEAMSTDEKSSPYVEKKLKLTLKMAIESISLADNMPLDERVALLKMMFKELSLKSKAAVVPPVKSTENLGSSNKPSNMLDACSLNVSDEHQNTLTGPSLTQPVVSNCKPSKAREVLELKQLSATPQNTLKARGKQKDTPKLNSITKLENNDRLIHKSQSKLFSVLINSKCVENYTQIKDERLPKLAPGLTAVRVPIRNADGGIQFASAVHLKALPSQQASLDEKLRFMQSLSALVNSGVLNGCSSNKHGCMVLTDEDLGSVRGLFKTLETAHALLPRFEAMSKAEKASPATDANLKRVFKLVLDNSQLIDNMPFDERLTLVKMLLDSLSSENKPVDDLVGFEHIDVSPEAKSNFLKKNPQTFDLQEFEQTVKSTADKANDTKSQTLQGPNSNKKISNFEMPFKYLNQHPLHKPSEKYIESSINNGVAYKSILQLIKLNTNQERTLPKSTQSQLKKEIFKNISLAYGSMSATHKKNYLRLVMLDNAASINPHQPGANARAYLDKFSNLNKINKSEKLTFEFNPPDQYAKKSINLSEFTERTEEWDFFGDESSDDGLKNSFMFSEVKKRLYKYNIKASEGPTNLNSVPANWPIRFKSTGSEHTAHIIDKLESLISSFEFSADRTITDVMKYKNKNQHNLLHVAVNEGYDPKVIAALIGLGVPVSAKDKNGDTPLHLAARQNQWAKAAIFPVSSHSIANNDGDTPFHLAAKNDDLSALRRMQVKNGGDILQLTNKQGETVKDIVEQKFGPIPEFKRAEPQQAR